MSVLILGLENCSSVSCWIGIIPQSNQCSLAEINLNPFPYGWRVSSDRELSGPKFTKTSVSRAMAGADAVVALDQELGRSEGTWKSVSFLVQSTIHSGLILVVRYFPQESKLFDKTSCTELIRQVYDPLPKPRTRESGVERKICGAVAAIPNKFLGTKLTKQSTSGQQYLSYLLFLYHQLCCLIFLLNNVVKITSTSGLGIRANPIEGGHCQKDAASHSSASSRYHCGRRFWRGRLGDPVQ